MHGSISTTDTHTAGHTSIDPLVQVDSAVKGEDVTDNHRKAVEVDWAVDKFAEYVVQEIDTFAKGRLTVVVGRMQGKNSVVAEKSASEAGDNTMKSFAEEGEEGRVMSSARNSSGRSVKGEVKWGSCIPKPVL